MPHLHAGVRIICSVFGVFDDCSPLFTADAAPNCVDDEVPSRFCGKSGVYLCGVKRKKRNADISGIASWSLSLAGCSAVHDRRKSIFMVGWRFLLRYEYESGDFMETREQRSKAIYALLCAYELAVLAQMH